MFSLFIVLGDNVLTAISVSRECGLINPNGKVYFPRFSQGTSSDPQTTIIWESLDDVNDLLDSDTLKVSAILWYKIYILYFNFYLINAILNFLKKLSLVCRMTQTHS